MRDHGQEVGRFLEAVATWKAPGAHRADKDHLEDNDVLSKRLSKEMTDRIGLPVSRTPCLARRTQRSRRFVLVTGRCVLSPVAPRSPTPRKTSFNSSSKDLVALLFVREGIEAPQPTCSLPTAFMFPLSVFWVAYNRSVRPLGGERDHQRGKSKTLFTSPSDTWLSSSGPSHVVAVSLKALHPGIGCHISCLSISAENKNFQQAPFSA